jgi:hypothetical protein
MHVGQRSPLQMRDSLRILLATSSRDRHLSPSALMGIWINWMQPDFRTMGSTRKTAHWDDYETDQDRFEEI